MPAVAQTTARVVRPGSANPWQSARGDGRPERSGAQSKDPETPDTTPAAGKKASRLRPKPIAQWEHENQLLGAQPNTT